jgi:phenylpropionate dioxygenase-like ring-hydroxylating dioxygenase large terminal subunit
MGVVQNTINANWKTCYKIGIEDYHVSTVHPRTLGKGGILTKGHFLYQRMHLHTAVLTRGVEGNLPPLTGAAFDRALAAFNAGQLPAESVVFSLFPNVILSIILGGVCLTQFTPLSARETRQIAWLYRLGPAGTVVDEAPFKLALAVAERVIGEDNTVVEALQRNAALGFGDGLLGAQEERISWFNAAYVTALQEAPEPVARTAADARAPRALQVAAD